MRRGAAILLALWPLAAYPTAAQAMNILGPCRDGHRWLATTRAGAPLAAYATCTEGQPLVIVACGVSDWPELRIAAAPGTRPPAPGETAIGSLTVDARRPLDLRLTRMSTDPAEGVVLRVQLTGEAMQAMARGFRARLDLAGTALEMHLGASHDVLTLFNRHC